MDETQKVRTSLAETEVAIPTAVKRLCAVANATQAVAADVARESRARRTNSGTMVAVKPAK